MLRNTKTNEINLLIRKSYIADPIVLKTATLVSIILLYSRLLVAWWYSNEALGIIEAKFKERKKKTKKLYREKIYVISSCVKIKLWAGEL